MSFHIAANTGCNLGCTYCYEEPDREMSQKQIDNEYDIEKIMSRLEDWAEMHPHAAPGMHGGEPCLLRMEHLERIFKFISENWEEPNESGEMGPPRTHIQSNGTLITDKHIEMFRKYRVNVGISCDGPVELNRNRLARSGGKDITDHMSKRTLAIIEKLANNGVGVGVITVLHEGNAGTDEKLELLLEQIDKWNRMGVTGHYNPAIPYESTQTDESLTGDRLAEVYIRTWEWMNEPGQTHRHWNPMRDFQDNLLGLGLSNCIVNTCDVYNAGAAQIIKGDGEQTGCGKTWAAVGDGVPFLQGESSDNRYNDPEEEERYEMLKQIPGACPHDEDPDDDSPDLGGLRGCRYWLVEQGGCPSAGIDGDYRNRSIFHEANHALYDRIEGDMRRMFPAIRLMTDLPWDTPISRLAQQKKVDIMPFAAMNPATSKKPGVWRGRTEAPEVFSIVNDLLDGTYEDTVRLYQGHYPKEMLTISPETYEVHADSNNLPEGTSLAELKKPKFVDQNEY